MWLNVAIHCIKCEKLIWQNQYQCTYFGALGIHKNSINNCTSHNQAIIQFHKPQYNRKP
eukprot:UN03404